MRDDDTEVRNATAASGGTTLTVQWRALGIGGLIIASAAIAALVVVASVQDAGALNTIALSLAILAFLIQIVVFIAQTWTSSQQMLQSQRLNADTTSLLSEVRATASGTQAMLHEQFNSVLSVALERELPEAIEEATSGEGQVDVDSIMEAVERTNRRLQEQTEAFTRQTQSSFVGSSLPRQKPTEDDERIIELLQTFPPEQEGRAAMDLLGRLSPRAVTVLKNFGDRERGARRRGERGRVLTTSPFSDELLALGLIEEVDPPERDGRSTSGRYTGLTDLGLQTVRLLTARRPYPEYVTQPE